MLDGFLQDRIPVSVSPEILIILVLISTLFTICLYYFIPRFLSPIFAILIFIFIIWLARYLYGAYGIVFDVVPVMLSGCFFSFPMTFIYRFFIVERQKRELQRNFAHYVDPVVVEKIASTGDDITL